MTDPTNPGTLYAGTFGVGVFKSTNGGASWTEASVGLTYPYVQALVIDPANPATLYAGTENRGVFKSTNAGASWSAVNAGLTSRNVEALVIDPSNTATLYAGGSGVFKSTDGGASWTGTGLTDGYVFVLAIDPANPTTLYAGTTLGGVFKSTNGGAGWTRSNIATNANVNDLAVDRTNPATLYAGTHGGGVFKSTDGGASWSAVNTGLMNLFVNAVAVDPANPATVYVGTDGSGVFKSTNGGTDWQPTGSGMGNPARPVVSDGGVVNNASYLPSPAPVAPGSIAAVFGSNLNDGSTVLSSSFGPDGRLVTSLGGASVRINNIPAPIFYSTPGQLGVQIPFELSGQTTGTIEVTAGGQASTSRTILLDAAAPGIFTISQDGRGTAAALHEDGVTSVTAQSPARPGEVVVLYATGLGTVTPSLPTGARSAGNVTVSTARVTIGGTPGEVQFSGTAPGFVGLNQINVRIPPNTGSAPNIPVVLIMGSRQSNTVTIPVSP